MLSHPQECLMITEHNDVFIDLTRRQIVHFIELGSNTDLMTIYTYIHRTLGSAPKAHNLFIHRLLEILHIFNAFKIKRALRY